MIFIVDYMDLIKSYLIPLVVPFVSVWFAYILTKHHSERTEQERLKVQRIKLLKLLKKEALLFKNYQVKHNEHRTKEFVTIKRVINGYEFNIDEHETLITLSLDLERINQNLDIVINTLALLNSSVHAGYINNIISGKFYLSLTNSKTFKYLTGKTQGEKVSELMNIEIKKILDKSTKDAAPIIEELIIEIDRLLWLEQLLKK